MKILFPVTTFILFVLTSAIAATVSNDRNTERESAFARVKEAANEDFVRHLRAGSGIDNAEKTKMKRGLEEYEGLQCSNAYTYEEESPDGRDFTITFPAGCACDFPLKAQYINKLSPNYKKDDPDDGIDVYKYEVHFVNLDNSNEFVLKAKRGYKKSEQVPNADGTVTFLDSGERMIFFVYYSDTVSSTQPGVPSAGPFTMVVLDGEVESVGSTCIQLDPTKNDWECEHSDIVRVDGKTKYVCDLIA